MLRRLAVAACAGVLTLVISVVWLVPLVRGPFSIDCGPLGPASCDARWRQVAAEQSSWLPVTRVKILEVTQPDGLCGTYYFERWIFANLITYDCL